MQSHEVDTIWWLSTDKVTERKEDAAVAGGAVGSACYWEEKEK